MKRPLVLAVARPAFAARRFWGRCTPSRLLFGQRHQCLRYSTVTDACVGGLQPSCRSGFNAARCAVPSPSCLERADSGRCAVGRMRGTPVVQRSWRPTVKDVFETLYDDGNESYAGACSMTRLTPLKAWTPVGSGFHPPSFFCKIYFRKSQIATPPVVGIP